MYVCLCMGVSDHEIREAVERGACSAAEVMACTGAGTRCGTCRNTIVEMVGGEPTAKPPSSVRRLPLIPVNTAA